MASQQSANLSLPHRQFLAKLDGHHTDSSDNDMTTDEEMRTEGYEDDRAQADSLVGISISKTQSRMRSPRTPTAVKEEALRQSSRHDYFVSEPETIDDANGGNDDLYHRNSSNSASTARVPSPLPGRSSPNRRSSTSRAFHNSHESGGRKRSGSGTTSLLGSLRKILPGSSAAQSGLQKSSTSEPDLMTRENEQEVDHLKGNQRSLEGSFHSATTGSNEERELVDSTDSTKAMNLDGNTSSAALEVPSTRPQSAQRTTSEASLYLRPAVTGASSFDDTSTYADIADMPNSRFKAITDSFQESSIKLPKLHGISITSSRASTKSDSDITRKNTLANSGHSQTTQATPLRDTMLQSDTTSTIPPDTKHPFLKDALSRASGDLVFMGGYRGSILRSAEPPHHQVWIPVKVGLNLRKVDLEVGLTHEDEERMEETIIPSGMLSHIGPIDISRRLLKKVRKSPNARSGKLRIHDYGYDWRLSPNFLSDRLIKFLESLECNQPDCPPEKRGAIVVAHSLGGLITRHAVNRRPELFSGVVYAGVPQNCCNILGPLRNGDDVLISSRVLTAQVNFTLRTSYALLPEDGRCFLNSQTGESYDIDFFDIKNWEEYRLSPCIKSPITQPVIRRKTLVDSITDSISSLTPSLPSKRFSISGNNTNNSDPSPPAANTSYRDRARIARDDVRSAARSTGSDFKDAAQNASDCFSTPMDAGGSLEPNMASSNNNNKNSPSPSPFSSSSSSNSRPNVATAVTLDPIIAHEYLARTLTEVKTFKSQLHHLPTHQSSNSYPPFAILFGKSMPTVYGAKVASREAIKYSDAYDDLAFATGDGVVLASAAQLPSGYRCVKGGRIESDRGHVGLLGDLEGIGRCISAVVEGRKRGIGMGKGDGGKG